MNGDESARGRIEQWMNIATNIVAPTTLLGALLFYFGYVSSRAQYAYFGVDVDTIGLSTQDYIMRSPQPLLVPLLVLPLAGAALFLADMVVRKRILRAHEADNVKGPKALRRIARSSAVCGLIVVFAGIGLLFIYPYISDWPLYGLVTPLVLASGAGLVAYASHLQRQIQDAMRHASGTRDSLPRADLLVPIPWAAKVLIYALIAASIFWAAATVAQWSGRGLAKSEAQHLDRLPSVILDTKEPLWLHDLGVEQTALLPALEGQTFHYRYRHLRLLIQGHNEMFLIPDVWSASDSTLIVPLDSSVRVQFQFQNDPP